MQCFWQLLAWCFEAQQISQVSWAYTHTWLLRPSTNFRSCLQWILHSFCVIDNATEDHIPLLQIILLKEVHLRQLATKTYQITPSWTPSSVQRIWLFAVCPSWLNPLSVMNSMVTKIQSKTWTRFPTMNTFNIAQTQIFNHCHLCCCQQKYTPPSTLRWATTLLSHGNTTLRVALRQTYRTIPTTRLRRVKSINISSVGSRKRVWRRTMTSCWRNNTPLSISQRSKMGRASRSSCLACQMIRLSGSGNCTLSRIWDGMTITNGLSNTGVETSSKAWDRWCGNQPAPSISFAPLSVAFTAIRHQNASILKCTLWTAGGRHR